MFRALGLGLGPNARVLILSGDDAVAAPLAEGLDRLGWRTVTARALQGALHALADFPIEAVIIDCVAGEDDAAAAAGELRRAYAPARLPVIALALPMAATAQDAFDLILPPAPHPAQAALRLEQAVRSAVAEDEFALRRETFADRGLNLDLPEEAHRPPRILVVGEPAPAFLALSNALQATSAEVVAAFTAYTAFDYLHERAFDAVVLWGGDDQSSALAIAGGMRRNTRLYHVPTLLYLRSNNDLNLSEAYNRGVTDVAAPDVSEQETAARVMSLALAYRRQTSVREALDRVRGSGLMDAATGLFTRDLFASHLSRLGRAAHGLRRPLSLCVLRVSDRPEVARARASGWLDKAMPQIGSMVARLVRSEDTAARLAPEVFALALPATSQPQARLVGERIAAVLGCTAFDAGEGQSPFVVEFDVGAAILGPGQTPADALEQAALQTVRREAG